MDHLERNELLSAYVDGELNAAELAQVERLLAESAEARQMVEELRSLQDSLAGLPTYKLEADFAQSVLRQAERTMLLGPIVNRAVVHGAVTHDASANLPSVGETFIKQQGSAANISAPTTENHRGLQTVNSDRDQRSHAGDSNLVRTDRQLSVWSRAIAAVGAVGGLAAAVLALASLTAQHDVEIAAGPAKNEKPTGGFREGEQRRLEPATIDQAAATPAEPNVTEFRGLAESSSVADRMYVAPQAGASDVAPRDAPQNVPGPAPAADTLAADRMSEATPAFGGALGADWDTPSNTAEADVALDFGSHQADRVIVLNCRPEDLAENSVRIEQVLLNNNIALLRAEDNLKESVADPTAVASSARRIKSAVADQQQNEVETISPEDGIAGTKKKAAAEDFDRHSKTEATSTVPAQQEVAYLVEGPVEQVEAALEQIKSEQTAPLHFYAAGDYVNAEEAHEDSLVQQLVNQKDSQGAYSRARGSQTPTLFGDAASEDLRRELMSDTEMPAQTAPLSAALPYAAGRATRSAQPATSDMFIENRTKSMLAPELQRSDVIRNNRQGYAQYGFGRAQKFTGGPSQYTTTRDSAVMKQVEQSQAAAGSASADDKSVAASRYSARNETATEKTDESAAVLSDQMEAVESAPPTEQRFLLLLRVAAEPAAESSGGSGIGGLGGNAPAQESGDPAAPAAAAPTTNPQ